MRLRFLGTAAAEGIPGLFCTCRLCEYARQAGGRDLRTRSQAVLDDVLLIDFPADTYAHMLMHPNIPFPDIEHLIVTHSHQDHFYPKEFSLRAPVYSTPHRRPFHVYGNHAVIRRYRNEAAIPANLFGAGIELHLLRAFRTVEIAGFQVTALPARHDPREICLLFDIRRAGRRLLYAHDTGVFGEPLWRYLHGQRYHAISLDCTMATTRHYRGHLDERTILEVRRRLLDIGAADAETLFIANHFSHKGGLPHAGLCALFEPYGFIVTYDGLQIHI